mmetsp:Transcript_16875/g.41820  ORF Transcript_16875/g.41820 Transcript_16875/m.41820 type:complete len:2471 (-) Transcript_16875:766-8178(-)|eukprot:CAMPEP_0178999974 /NCGR_PEP_ID=MMETSP0795-20121207/10395_1 /TAXON_ID=88552 /ORGANISM="Amoebophrya sp., Strain Ameob2" /LENGTH=2470 /DNA_ID=CAMNT_0020692881 /DNA_START=159 /DNA_END=7571 /DNA_ORIENTATION=-
MRAVRLSLAFGATGSSSSSSSGGRSSTAAQNHHGTGNQERQSDKWTASSLGEARPRPPSSTTPATPSRTNHRRLNYNKRSSRFERDELSRQTGPSAPGPEHPRVFDEGGKELARDAKGRLLALYNPRTKQLNRLFDEDGKEYVVHDITRNVRSHAIGEEPRGGPGGSIRRELEVGEDGRDSEVFRKARPPKGSGATVDEGGPPGDHEEDDRQAHQTIKTLLRDQSPSDESGASSTRALAAGAVASIPPGLTDGVVYADHDLPPVDGSESLLHDGSDNGPAPESTIKVSGIGDHATVQRKVDVRWSAAPRELVQEVVPIRPEDADDARDTRALEGREGTVGRTSAAVSSSSSSETRGPEGASYTADLLLHSDSSSRTKAETRPTLPNEQAGGSSSSSKATTSTKAKPAEGAQGSSDPGLRQPFHKRLPADLRVREITPGVFVMDADSALEKDADRVQKLLQYSLHAGDAKPIPKPTGSAVGIEVATEVHIGSSPDEVWASVRSVASFPKHLVASTLYSSSEVEGHHSDPPDVEATTASRGASTSEAPSPDDCFYGSSVCRECRGRQECLAKNQLNLNDYGVVGDDEGALVGKDAFDVRRIPVGEDGVSSSNDWDNLSGPSDGSPGAEPAHRKSGAARSSTPATKKTKTKEPASSAGVYGNFVDTLDSWTSIGKQLVASLTERAQPAPEEFLAGLEASRARSRKLVRRELAAERLLGIRPSGKKKNSKAESGVGYSEAGALEALSLETEEDSFRRRLDAELRARNALRLTPEAYAEILREVRSTPRFDEKSKNSNAGNNRRGRAPLQLALDRSRQDPAVRSGPHYLKRKLLTAAEEAAWKRSMEFTEECITAGGISTRQLQADTSELAPVSSWTSSWAGSWASSFRPTKSLAPDLREDGLGTARPRGVLADLERQLLRDRQARLREPGKDLQVSAETPQAQLQRRKMDRKKPLATLLTQQRRLQTYLKSTFTGQTDQCLCYHENNIFKPVLDLFPLKLPDFRECLTLHYAMGSSWQGVCTLEDACKYSSRIAAEMQLVAQPNQQCNCELCIWGEAWHATGQASASCPNNHAELWRDICLPCKAESSIDIAAMSDADVPKRSRFEKIGQKGECVDKSLRFVRGRGGVVGSHLQCRDICWQTIGLDCLGYSYFHCSKRCIIHLQQSGMHKMSQWTKVKGEGDVIVGTDNTCGAECYRVTYGECPPGQIASGGVDVKWEERMVYGQSDVFVCPSPYTGQVTITCAGANSQTVEGMCMEPCPSGQLVYRPGLTPIAYPVTPIATRRRLPCPFDPQNAASNIELLCQSDRSILVVSPNCGASCAPGMYALKIGGGIISYSFMKHRQKVPLFDCPFGYVGKLDLICVDGQVQQEQPTPDTGCFLHCNAKHDMNVDRTSTANATTDVQLRAEFDLNEAQWIGNPSRLYMNETLQLATMSTQFMEGIFFKHDSILNAPCKPSPLTYGFIQVKCSNGIISALGEACKFNCPAGSIEAGTGGHSLQMFHGYLEDWHSVDVVCPTAQWTGTVQLSCRNGLLSRRESDVCMRHCNVDYLVSNGLNIPMGMQLMHDSLTNVTCAAGGNPKFAGKLQVHCFNGAVNVIGRCGQFCASTMLISNDAMVLTYRQDHDETRGYPCPSPWTGVLILSCDDQKINEEASCGQMCYASTHLVRGISNMPFPKAGDVAQGMIGIDHGKTYDAGCPVATDSLSYTGGLVLQCDNGEVTEHSGACFWNCDKLIVNSGGFPQTIDYLKHDTNDTFTCAAGLDTGYLVLRCFDQQLTIEKGSCAASPCPPGSVKAVATRDAALPHPLIFHLGQVTLTCPEPYTGTLTLACDNKAITFPFANCGNRCQVNGTIYPNTLNTYGLPIYGGIKIYTPLMDHSTQVSLTCPANTKGTVTIECDDGTPKQVAGGCNNPCPPDMFVTPTGALIPLLYMEHGDVRTNIPCPVGTTMGGTIDVACVNGTYNRTQGVCLTNCPSRDFTSNTVEMRHPTIAHGQSYAADCGSWNPDYTGLIVVSCSEGAVTDSGRCSRHCPPGSVVSNGATVPYERILHGTQVNLTCSLANVGTIDFAHTLALGCNDGAVSIATSFQNGKANATGTCMRNCLGPTKLFGTSFNHGLIKEGTMVQVDCPGPGLLMLQCVDGIASPYNSKCFQTCPPSTLLDGRGIAISWNISITHDTVYEAPCDPSVASLHAEVKCLDGTPRIQASYCKLNCNEGQIEQPDPEELYKYPILLSHNASVHGGEQVVSCPSHLAGRATVRCDDSVVKIVAGSCGTSNCMPSKLLSGENLLISYPQMNHAETYETDCGAGFIGRIKFRCNEGVALREWIRMNYLNQINNMVETVELCECCLTNGVSSMTVGDGQHEFAAGSDEAVGWVSAGALFSIVLFFGLYWNNYWSRYVTPKIQKSWLMRYYRERKAKNAAAARGALQAKIAASQNVGISRALEAVEDGDEESGSSAGSQNAIEDHGYENKVAPIQDAV